MTRKFSIYTNVLWTLFVPRLSPPIIFYYHQILQLYRSRTNIISTLTTLLLHFYFRISEADCIRSSDLK